MTYHGDYENHTSRIKFVFKASKRYNLVNDDMLQVPAELSPERRRAVHVAYTRYRRHGDTSGAGHALPPQPAHLPQRSSNKELCVSLPKLISTIYFPLLPWQFSANPIIIFLGDNTISCPFWLCWHSRWINYPVFTSTNLTQPPIFLTFTA